MIKNIDAALLYQMAEQNNFLCALSFFNSYLTANVKNIKQKLFKMTNTDKPIESKTQLKFYSLDFLLKERNLNVSNVSQKLVRIIDLLATLSILD